MPNKLPQGWVECQLGEVFEIVTGKTPPKKYPEYFNGDIPFVKPGDLDKEIYITQTEGDSLTVEGLKYAPNLPKNTVLVSCIGNLGKKAILGIIGSCNQQINAIIPNSYIENKYTYFYIDKIVPWLEANASATTVKILNKGKFEQAPFILPPLNEQKRIVEKIESEFAKIDEGLEHLEKAKEQIKQYRQSVLKSAFEGKLTQQNPDDESAEILLHKINSKAKFIHNDNLPQGWVECQLKDIGDIISGGTPATKDADNFGGNIAWITPADLSDYKEKFISRGKRNITEKGLKNSSAKLMPKGSILFSSRAPIGYTVIAANPICTNQGFKNIVPCKYVFNQYIYYYLKSSKTLIEKYSSGTTFKEISGAKFGLIPFLLPPLNEQKMIVEEIEKRFAIADEVEKAVEQNIEKAKQLKQSILKKAFEGRLVPQDPNDEPASILLKKIKQERSKK